MSAAAEPRARRRCVWLNDPLNWTNPGGILDRLGEHLMISAAGGAARLPGGLADRALARAHRAGRRRWWCWCPTLTLAIPTLALLTILPLTFLGFGRPPVVVALAVFAVPPLLANAYTGVRQADPEARDAARGMGLSGGQVLRRVELPLAVPYLAAGFRTAAVQVVATAALASFVNGGGLGEIIRAGFGLEHRGRRRADHRRRRAGGRPGAARRGAARRCVERLVTPRPLRRGRQRAPARPPTPPAGPDAPPTARPGEWTAKRRLRPSVGDDAVTKPIPGCRSVADDVGWIVAGGRQSGSPVGHAAGPHGPRRDTEGGHDARTYTAGGRRRRRRSPWRVSSPGAVTPARPAPTRPQQGASGAGLRPGRR